jgi:hypothetical protein
MKFNKWTVGLAAVGAVSLASVAQAEEKASSVMTAVSSTTLSGYVDTSMEWNPGTGTRQPGYAFNGGKQDGFNLDVVDLKISKALDESEWAAGYMVDIFVGPDGAALGTGSILKQAYVNLRTPVGNGLDWKIGVFDNIIGYESTESPNNPNFTRSYGYTLEPTTLTGILASYKFSELVSASLGIADTVGPGINSRAFSTTAAGAPNGGAETYKTYVGSVSLTAPNDWGFVSGSSLYAGFNNGWNSGLALPALNANSTGAPATDLYVGLTLNTPVTGLKVGAAYDYWDSQSQHVTGGGPAVDVPQSWANDIALYASYQATEKLSVHGRAEYLWHSRADQVAPGAFIIDSPVFAPREVLAYTATVQYDLWKNVLSRLEVRWDHQASGGPKFYGAGTGRAQTINGVAGTEGSLVNSWLLAANIIYKF